MMNTKTALSIALCATLGTTLAVHAQACNSSDANWAVAAGLGRTQRQGDTGVEGWSMGAHAEFNPNSIVAGHASYQYESLPGADVHTAGAGLGFLIRLPGEPCIAFDALVGIGGALSS